ncbi:TPA: PixG protein [Proteus mirabilis]|uniref:PixG protein n=1 Tax=Proteus mirabilis TaxID=584 RepID=UPI0029E99A9E|nr:PixG protein [Proteus mirabilis]HEK2724483.1 PixG protein [Proteus mirabilis]
MNKILIGIALFSVAAPYSFGWQQNFLHVPSSGNAATATAPSLNVTDSTASGVIKVTIPQVKGWRVIVSYCSGSGSQAEEGNYRYWIRLPQTNTWQKHSSGLSYYLSNLSWNVSGSNNHNNEVYVGPNYFKKQNPSACHSVGTVWGLGSEVLPLDRTMSLTVAVSRATAYPGLYNLDIPFAWAYEENKGSGNNSTGYLQFANAMKPYMNNYINIPVSITSKCNIKNQVINLSHGNMTPEESINNVTSPYNYQLTCDYDASVSVSLIGSAPVSGKTENYTKCGNGGSCELKYNDNEYKGNFKLNAGVAKTFSITSTFHPNDIRNPVEGSFQGSAILRILVD